MRGIGRHPICIYIHTECLPYPAAVAIEEVEDEGGEGEGKSEGIDEEAVLAMFDAVKNTICFVKHFKIGK